ncbi:MAG: hypothetical protein TR69_WS6001000980 [candidate division WS6 bacterium OLB20]|uniref:Putative auto-transporter adhesin head GIN domain-containing protein n=1 Tax=candidate division WS6 bacterium OLB20 TaxID=1617426 RepID=A0A136LZA7_9BACT|nr:MAG: hypothetical protein TR69_WS6001000980 [candidate division WS6 bacterium OLB20]
MALTQKQKVYIFGGCAVAVVLSLCCMVVSAVLFRSMFVGSGNVVTRDTDVDDFSSFEFNGAAEVRLIQGDSTSVSIQGEDNVLDTYTVSVADGRLTVGTERRGLFDVIPTKPVIVTVYLEDITEIDLNGAADFNADRLQLRDVTLRIDGASSVTMDLFADSLTAVVNGAGSVELLGNTNKLDLTLNGAGSFSSAVLRSRECTVTINGAGSALVNCASTLDATINGTGSIEYLGDPQLTQEINGLGTIKKGNE